MVTHADLDADLQRAHRRVAALEAKRGPIGIAIPAGYDLDDLVEIDPDSGDFQQVALPERRTG